MSVTLLGRAGDTFEASIAAQTFDPGVVVAHRWMGITALEQRLFDTAACRDGSVDLVLVPADWLPRLAATGAIRPLDALVARAAPEGWPEAWSHAFVDVVTANEALWGLPFHDGPPLLIYRADLFESADECAAYREAFGVELVPARTWSEFDRQARWFTRPADGLYGTVLAGAPDGHNNVYDFVTQLRVRGGDVLDGLGRPAFGGEPGLGALAWLRRHLADDPTVPPESPTLDSVGSGATFASGRIALMMNWAGYAHAAEQPESTVRGRVKTTIAPAGDDGTPTPVVNAFWALAVTAGAEASGVEHLDDVWGVVRECLSARGDLATTAAGSSGTRLDTWSDLGIVARTPAFTLFERAHEASRPLPQVPELPALVEILNDLVESVVGRGEPAEPALARALASAEATLVIDSADV